jgi:hypothetical protein
LALDVCHTGVIRLVNAFLATCLDYSPSNGHGGASAAQANTESKWAEDTCFAGSHELGMCLCWGLSRVVSVEGEREVRVC